MTMSTPVNSANVAGRNEQRNGVAVLTDSKALFSLMSKVKVVTISLNREIIAISKTDVVNV